MKVFTAITFVAGVLFLCSISLAQTDQTDPQADPQTETENMGAEPSPAAGLPYGFPYGTAVPQTPKRSGASRLGEWICRDEPPPPGHVITRGGSMGSCAGTCASRYIEPLRDHMVICAGQEVPEGYELLGVTTVADCDCVADAENGLIIQLKSGYIIKRQGAVRNWNAPESEYSTDDLSGE